MVGGGGVIRGAGLVASKINGRDIQHRLLGQPHIKTPERFIKLIFSTTSKSYLSCIPKLLLYRWSHGIFITANLKIAQNKQWPNNFAGSIIADVLLPFNESIVYAFFIIAMIYQNW